MRVRKLPVWRQAIGPVLAVALLNGCATSELAVEPEWQSVAIGLCEDYPEESRTLEAARADLEAARAAGAEVLRIAFGWDAMEPEPGRYDWSFWDEYVSMAVEEYGIRLIPYVCYTPRWAATDEGDDVFWRSPPREPADFARFMKALAVRYGDEIDSWELWNEPDNPAYWTGTAEEFAALVRAGSEAVREADPGAQVVLGGIATEVEFLDTLFSEHGIAPEVDVVNLHSYFETWHPDPIESLSEYIDLAQAVVREHGEDEPLWMAETGYSDMGDRSSAAQANALVRAFALCLASGQLELIAWYRINDLPTEQDVIGDAHNRHLGVREVGGARKPAFTAFQRLASWFDEPFRIMVAEINDDSPEGVDVQARSFELSGGRALVVAWIGEPDPAFEPSPEVERGAAAQIWLPPFEADYARFTDALGHAIESERTNWIDGQDRDALELALRPGEVVFCELGKQ